MPFGLCNAPAPFQRDIDIVLSGLSWRICLVYIDDIIITASGFQEEPFVKVFVTLWLHNKHTQPPSGMDKFVVRIKRQREPLQEENEKEGTSFDEQVNNVRVKRLKNHVIVRTDLIVKQFWDLAGALICCQHKII
jgi:hypothetical protein